MTFDSEGVIFSMFMSILGLIDLVKNVDQKDKNNGGDCLSLYHSITITLDCDSY